jgi:hypothetical protein
MRQLVRESPQKRRAAGHLRAKVITRVSGSHQLFAQIERLDRLGERKCRTASPVPAELVWNP